MSRQPHKRGCRSISCVYRKPIQVWRFWFPFGARGDGPPCILQRPLGIAGDWQGFPFRVLAPQWSTYRGV